MLVCAFLSPWNPQRSQGGPQDGGLAGLCPALEGPNSPCSFAGDTEPDYLWLCHNPPPPGGWPLCWVPGGALGNSHGLGMGTEARGHVVQLKEGLCLLPLTSD